jgi:hypothetical protein
MWCNRRSDQNHRSIPLLEQPAVRWYTGLLFCILWHVLARPSYLAVLAWQAEFGIFLEHLKYFFLSEMYILVYVHCTFSKIILLLFFWTRVVGTRRLNPKKAYHRRIPNLETVTVHRRSDSKRAYRPQAVFLKLSLTAMIKCIKNRIE